MVIGAMWGTSLWASTFWQGVEILGNSSVEEKQREKETAVVGVL